MKTKDLLSFVAAVSIAVLAGCNGFADNYKPAAEVPSLGALPPSSNNPEVIPTTNMKDALRLKLDEGYSVIGTSVFTATVESEPRSLAGERAKAVEQARAVGADLVVFATKVLGKQTMTMSGSRSIAPAWDTALEVDTHSRETVTTIKYGAVYLRKNASSALGTNPSAAQVSTSLQNSAGDLSKFFDDFNGGSSGGIGRGLGGPQGFNPYNALSRLDDSVTLTDDQKPKAMEIFNTEAEMLNAISQEDRPEKGAKFRQAASAQIRALLTPEQLQRLDANRHEAQARATTEQALMANFIRSSKNISARVGTVTSMSLLGSSDMSIDESRKGDYIYNVTGGTKSETLKIYWEQASPTDQIKIVKIEGGDGETISL